MNIETAETTRIGDREVNQDRACVVVADTEILLAVCDGMGGHSAGEAAAQAAIDIFTSRFKSHRPSRAEMGGFLEETVRLAHKAVYQIGARLPLEKRPRTTCTACLVVDGVVRWAHVGDSRVYHFRKGRIHTRTRDHSAVESLYQQGFLTQEQTLTHPLRNLVEHCLGGEPDMPRIDLGNEVVLEPGDVLLLCTDGLWASLDDAAVAQALSNATDLQEALDTAARTAEQEAHPHSDNVTAVAMRWLGEE
ncbi:MAG TPA: protein phosphatase 2C domain-containing protein [Gammaproteobacteria bacterium]|nr:protein phosphatase 2C domain-containing protein [Gammaproteobacteria bacterium]